MHLYALTLQKPTAINKAIYGSFSGPKAQELIVARGRILELLRPDESRYLGFSISNSHFLVENFKSSLLLKFLDLSDQ